LFKGKQVVANGTEPPKSPYHNPNVVKYNYDVKLANQLLDEAGWKMSGDGIRRKSGQPLNLTLMSTSGNKSRERYEQLLQADWRKIGVDLEIKNQPAKVFFGETMRKRKFTHLAMYSWIKDPLALSDTLWRCDYIPSPANNFMGQNQPGFCDKRTDELLKKASRELDDQKRAKIGQEVESILAEELPALPLFFRVDVSVTKKGLVGWKPTGTLQPLTWNVQEWTWVN
jgi:peptide/nickel transport system substrate-binding protein